MKGVYYEVQKTEIMKRGNLWYCTLQDNDKKVNANKFK